MSGKAVELGAVTGQVAGDGGIEHGARLIAFTDAVLGSDDGRLAREREALRAVITPEAFVDTCALIGAFNVVDRVADATGSRSTRCSTRAARTCGTSSASRASGPRRTRPARAERAPTDTSGD